MSVIFKADPEALQAIESAFGRLMDTTRKVTDSFLQAANRSAAGLDAASMTELRLVMDSAQALTTLLNRFCTENSNAAHQKKAILSEIAQLTAR